jgi:hypothetical protein
MHSRRKMRHRRALSESEVRRSLGKRAMTLMKEKVLMRVIDSGTTRTEEGRYCRVRDKRCSRAQEGALSQVGKRVPSRMIEWGDVRVEEEALCA